MVEAEYVGLKGLVHQRIVVDPDAGRVTFFNCHWPRRFLTEADAEYTCRLSELKGVAISFYDGRLAVKTPAGWGYLISSAAGFEDVSRALRRGVPQGARMAWHEYPGVRTFLFCWIGAPLSIVAALIATVMGVIVLERWNLSSKPIEWLLICLMLLPVVAAIFVFARFWWRKRKGN